MPPLLQLRDIGLTLGGTPLLETAELSISPGDRIALVGRNGSGKSTLLRIAAGQLTADRGTRFQQPSAQLAFLPQEPDMSGFATALDYVLAGLGEHDDPHAARTMMAELEVDPDAEPGNLSGGEARRAALARVLSQKPEILLLDEPTNHLDLIAIEWLESHLLACRSAIALISHDKRLLADLSNATVWLDRGTTHRLDRGFADFEVWRDAKLEEEEADRRKLDRRIEDEEHWMRYGVTARRKRNMRRVGELQTLRRERREARRSVGLANMVAQDAKASGALVVEAERISKAYGDNVLVRDFSLRIMRGDRIGVIGANGAGKTTLINLLTGALAPDSGEVRIGSNVLMARLDQSRAVASTLDDAGRRPDRRRQRLCHGQRRAPSRHRLHEGFFVRTGAGAHADRKTVGRRARPADACASLGLPSNLIVLDEPTNDLDVETLDLLQELLGEYKGTILLVSHDRDFLDRVATSVIVSEGGGRWQEYAGGYSDMVAQRGYGLRGPPAAPAAKAERAPAPARDRAAPKRKLSFHEKRALEVLPERMKALRRELDALEAKLADPDFAAREPAAFPAATIQYGRLREELEKAEDEWLALEILREGLEQAQ